MTALPHKNTNACAIIFLSGKKECVVIIMLSKQVWGKKKNSLKKKQNKKTLMPPPPPIARSYTGRDQRAHCLTNINVEHLTMKNNTIEGNKKH